MSASILLIEPPSAFRDALVRAAQAAGATAEVRDDAMEALASLTEFEPSVVLVSEDPGPPGAGSLCRILRRKQRGVTVFRLGDPATRDAIDEASAVVPRSIGAERVVKALLGSPGVAGSAADAAPARAWEATVGNLELGPLLIAVAERWLTGRLVLTTAALEREICFVRGMPVFSRSSLFSERLGVLAVRSGEVTQPVLDAALDLARASGVRLGQALLRQGAITGGSLLQLLCAQLSEQVIAACNGPACQARFVLEDSVADGELVLRLHPMTALLLASQRMAAGDLTRVLEQLGDRPVVVEAVPHAIEAWLCALGLGKLAPLLADAETVRDIRERLHELLPENEALPAASSDALTLALLRAGAVKLPGRMSLPPPDLRSVMSSLAPPSLAAAVDRCARQSYEAWPISAQVQRSDERAKILDDYLHGARPAELAKAVVLQGPVAEARTLAADLVLQCFRAECAHPRAWLGLPLAASDHELRTACHALHQRIEAQLAPESPAHARLLAMDLQARLQSVLAQTPEHEPALEDAVPPPPPSAARGARHSKAPPPPPRLVTSIPPPAKRGDAALALVPEVEQLLQQGKWRQLRALLGTRESDPTKLAPALGLLYAIALKEDGPPDESAGQSAKRLEADTLGIRAMSQVLGVSEESATALVLAKRMLRRRPIEWNQKPPARISVLLILVALAIGAGVGLLLSPGLINLPWK